LKKPDGLAVGLFFARRLIHRQQIEQSRFANTGFASDGDVFTGLNDEAEILNTVRAAKRQVRWVTESMRQA